LKTTRAKRSGSGASPVDVLGRTPAEITKGVANGEIPVCVVGMGHIGLPLALLLVAEGARVIGCDKDERSLDLLRKGRTPIVEHSKNLFPSSVVLDQSCPSCGIRLLRVGTETFCPGCMRRADASSGTVRLSTDLHSVPMRAEASHEMEDLLASALASGRLELTTDTTGAVRRSGFVVFAVGTPIDANKEPDNGAMTAASRDVGRGLQKGAVVMVRSTVSPGTTEGLVGTTLAAESGLRPGPDFGLAHVPETTIEGMALLELRTLPKMVGGVDERSARAAGALFSVFGTPVHFFDGPKITETAKLFCNIYRDVNIALANELAQACELLGVDVMKAIEASRTDPKTNVLTPGPGVGGYCLTKDAFYLTEPASKLGFTSELISLAREVNDSMPSHVHKLTTEAFGEAGLKMKAARIAILGVAFKGNTGDTRESPSFSVVNELRADGAEIVVHDPLVHDDDRRLLDLGVGREKTLKGVMKGAVAALVLTDHIEYRGLTGAGLKKLDPDLKVVVDARHILDPGEVRAAGLVYRGVGHGRPPP
jgi:UDP-N-acetyl-D-mannosaminuronic acid dehydrogenase